MPACLANLIPKNPNPIIAGNLAGAFFLEQGHYPAAGQLERCSKPYFDLIEELDFTNDYRLSHRKAERGRGDKTNVAMPCKLLETQRVIQ